MDAMLVDLRTESRLFVQCAATESVTQLKLILEKRKGLRSTLAKLLRGWFCRHFSI